VRADTTVDVVLRYLRLRGELPDHTDHLYVVNRRHQLMGWVAIQDLVTSDPNTPINRLIDEQLESIHVDETSAKVAREFSDNDWVSAPVVDDANVLLGRITIDDVVDIIREQAEHQALGAAGLDEDEDLFSPVLRATRRRLIWLSINLGTAFVAAGVVGQFEATIDQLVALAVLMPIVAGMGGNAGTQVLALMVRGLALGQVGASNVRVLLWKELRVALLNGVALGVVLGLVVYAWFGSAGLSLVIATALTCNLLLAASAGVLVPLTLKRLGFDPALASSIFLTTVTDVMGFFTFLGLATLLLLR
jgi:magnesium transporter